MLTRLLCGQLGARTSAGPRLAATFVSATAALDARANQRGSACWQTVASAARNSNHVPAPPAKAAVNPGASSSLITPQLQSVLQKFRRGQVKENGKGGDGWPFQST